MRPVQPRAARCAARGRGRRGGDTREQLYRLRRRCEGGLVLGRAGQNAEASSRTGSSRRASASKGEEMPLRNAQAQARGPPVVARPGRSSERFRPQRARSSTPTGSRLYAHRGGPRSRLLRIGDRSSRNEEEKDISLPELSTALQAAAGRGHRELRAASARGGSRACSATERPEIPSSYHTAYMRRLSPLEATYTKERATEICLQTLARSGSTCRRSRTSSSTSTTGPEVRRVPV